MFVLAFELILLPTAGGGGNSKLYTYTSLLELSASLLIDISSHTFVSSSQMRVTSQRFIAPEKTKLPAAAEKGSSMDIFQLALDSGNLLKKKLPGAAPSAASSSSSASKSRPPGSSSSLLSNHKAAIKKKLLPSGGDSTTVKAADSTASKDPSKKNEETLPASFNRKSSVLGKYKIPKRPEDEDQPEASSGIAVSSSSSKTEDTMTPMFGPNVFTTNLREQFAQIPKDSRGSTTSGGSGGDVDSPVTTPKSNNIFQRFHKDDGASTSTGYQAPPPPPLPQRTLPAPQPPVAPPVEPPKTSNFWSMMRPNENVVVKPADTGVAVSEASSSVKGIGLTLYGCEGRGKLIAKLLLSTTELKNPSRTIVLQGWMSDVPKFKHGTISKRFELQG